MIWATRHTYGAQRFRRDKPLRISAFLSPDWGNGSVVPLCGSCVCSDMKPSASVFSCADQPVNEVNCRDRFLQFHRIWAHPCVLQAHACSSHLLCKRYALFACVAHCGTRPLAPSRAGQALVLASDCYGHTPTIPSTGKPPHPPCRLFHEPTPKPGGSRAMGRVRGEVFSTGRSIIYRRTLGANPPRGWKPLPLVRRIGAMRAELCTV